MFKLWQVIGHVGIQTPRGTVLTSPQPTLSNIKEMEKLVEVLNELHSKNEIYDASCPTCGRREREGEG